MGGREAKTLGDFVEGVLGGTVVRDTVGEGDPGRGREEEWERENGGWRMGEGE